MTKKILLTASLSSVLTLMTFTVEITTGQFARAIESGRQNQDGAITDEAVLEAFDDALAFVQEADSYDELLDLPGVVRHLEGPILEAVFEQLPWYLKTYLLAEQFVVDQCSSDESNGQTCLSRRARALKSVLEDLAPFHGYQLVRTEDGFAMQGDHNVHIDLSNAADGRPRLAIAGQSIVELSQQNQATLLQTTHDGKATEKAETLIDETLDNLGMAIGKLTRENHSIGFTKLAYAVDPVNCILILLVIAVALVIFIEAFSKNQKAKDLKQQRIQCLEGILKYLDAEVGENETSPFQNIITTINYVLTHIRSSDELDGIRYDSKLADLLDDTIVDIKQLDRDRRIDVGRSKIIMLETIVQDLGSNSEKSESSVLD